MCYFSKDWFVTTWERNFPVRLDREILENDGMCNFYLLPASGLVVVTKVFTKFIANPSADIVVNQTQLEIYLSPSADSSGAFMRKFIAISSPKLQTNKVWDFILYFYHKSISGFHGTRLSYFILTSSPYFIW